MARTRVIALLVGALLLALSGCSLFFREPPPDDLIKAAQQYAAEVRELPGVKTAEADVDSTGSGGGQWRVTLIVDATSADGLATVPAAVATVQPPADAPSSITVRIPAAPDLARVVVSDPTAADLERAQKLRELPFAESVSLLYGRFSVALFEDTRLSDAATGVRAGGVLTADPLDSVQVAYVGGRIAMDVSAAGPSDALMGMIEALSTDPDVTYISSTEPSQDRPRPRITLSVDHPTRVADALAEFAEETVAGRPRTAFGVSDADDYIDGFVGLPLGSAEPDDIPPPEEPPGLDPAVLETQLAGDAASVTEFLGATVASSGIPGTPAVFVGGCTDLDVSGQVQGTLLLPVFDYEASAERAYDAIVAGWEAAGYAHTDQATGLSIYTPNDSRAVVQLSIRGTSEGIEVTAQGECRS